MGQLLLEPPFRDGQFDRSLICNIMGGPQPTMSDSAPGIQETY